MKEFNLQKCMAGASVVTREGEDYKFGACNPYASEGYELVGWLSNGELKTHSTYGNARFGASSPYDLFMKEVEIVHWVNIYPINAWHPYKTKEEADTFSGTTRIACIKVTYKEGEGL